MKLCFLSFPFKRDIFFYFDDNPNLCGHDDVHMCMCVCVCANVCQGCFSCEQYFSNGNLAFPRKCEP